MSEQYDPQFYAATHRGNEGDVEFYTTICEGARSVLELGCGSGRVLAAVVPPLATGLGVDLHEGLLALARDRARGPNHPPAISYQRGDMRTLDLGRRFDRVLIPYSGLFCLGDPAGLRACLDVAAAHLAPDGFLALDAYAADGFHHLAPQEDMGQLDEWTELEAIEIDGASFTVHERSRWNRDAQTIEAHYRYVGPNERVYEASLPQRYVLAEELMLASMHAGLEPSALYGGFDQRPFNPEESEHLIFVAQHAPAADTED